MVFHTSRGFAEKSNRHYGSDLGYGVVDVQRSIAKAKRKQQNFVISVTMHTPPQCLPCCSQSCLTLAFSYVATCDPRRERNGPRARFLLKSALS